MWIGNRETLDGWVVAEGQGILVFLASSLIGSIGVREIGLSLEGNSWLTRMWCDG